MILLIVPQQLIMAEKDTMGKYMYWTCVAATLLLKVIQGMWSEKLLLHDYIVS